ncbi:hypothetical protein ABZP36_011570 [Zizania latifolia]
MEITTVNDFVAESAPEFVNSTVFGKPKQEGTNGLCSSECILYTVCALESYACRPKPVHTYLMKQVAEMQTRIRKSAALDASVSVLWFASRESDMKGAKSKGAAKADAKLAVKSKGAEKPAKGRKGKAGKDPNKPKRAPSAFFVFMEEFRKEFKEKNPKNKSVAAVGKAAGDRWKSLTEADKAPYVAKANKLKAEYNKAIAAYNKGESTAKKAPAKEEEDEDEEESDKSKSEVNDEDDDEGSEEDEDDDE